MSPASILLFDLDGVLIDSEPVHARHWSEILRDAGFTFSESECRGFVGLRSEAVAQWARESNPALAAKLDVEALMDLKRERFFAALPNELELVAGADAFLRAQRGQRRLGLVTSTRLRAIGKVLLRFEWRNMFEVVVGGDHVANAKPHPEPYLQAIERLRAAPETCLVFEDSLPGVRSARAAGLAVCGLSTSHEAEALREAGAQWVIRDFTETATLAEALEGVGGNAGITSHR